ncbi:MAG TPA: DUF58 domain-containing protein [Burkholderiales bacterium]|nr:DUF58 domain-containing protein [Burkholderiales bacterium]
MIATLRNRFTSWLFQWRDPEPGAITLVQRRVFILPTRFGVIYAGTLLLMLTGAINYSLSLGFVLTFLLAGLGVNSIIHTFRNLAHLRISPGRAPPVFAGDTAQFALTLENQGPLDRYSIGITRDRNHISYVDVPARQSIVARVAIPAIKRGTLRAGRLTLFTTFPLGLCRAWAYASPNMQCLVYPRPEAPGIALPASDSSEGSGFEHGSGREDFSGLRSYHPGDSPRHIAWKAAARDQTLYVKQFSGAAAAELWLDWRQLPDAFGIEVRLSRLTRWVLDAHAAGLSFGLRMPGVVVPPAPGDAQRDRCLQALALFGEISDVDRGR